MEFARFHRITWSSVLAGDKGTNTAYFGQFRKPYKINYYV